MKQYLEISDNRKFDIILDGLPIENNPFYFDGDYLYNKYNDNAETEIVYYLMVGTYEIKMRPFVPKYGEKYYIIHIDGAVCADVNELYVSNLAKIKCGWVFRTENEALANKERVIKEMKEVIYND